MNGFQIPGDEEFKRRIELYERNEKRGPDYFRALNYISQTWGNPNEMAEGIKLLLHSWHWNFYRFGDFDFNKLRNCIETNLQIIARFKDRDIYTLLNSEEPEIKELFNQFLDALQGGKRKSPVAVAKALHLLAPGFFPLWDNDIALEYGYVWNIPGIQAPAELFAASDYVSFCWKMKEIAEGVKDFVPNADDRSLLKRIDEYNFARFSRFAIDWK